MRRVFFAFAIAAATSSATGAAKPAAGETTTCLLVESAAQGHNLPVEFFARVIWQESRFNADAIGPLTRSGKRAQGIAQFMPGTAAERGLLDPFDPVQALPKAAGFLRDLRREFGNLGLAAAAYNAGPGRVRDWLAGERSLPAETRRYVWAITGRTAEAWRNSADGKNTRSRVDCDTLMAQLETAPNTFVAALERRVREAERKPWGVQLAASFSRANALRRYARLIRLFDSVIGDRDPIVLHHIDRSRGTRPLYQIRVGAATRNEADRLCGHIRRHDGACLVLRTR